MTEQKNPTVSVDLIDKGLLATGVIAAIALLLHEESIDSARPVFVGVLILVLTSLLYRTIRWLRQWWRRRAARPASPAVLFTPRSLGDRHRVQTRIEEVLRRQTVIDHDTLFGVEVLLRDIQGYLADNERHRIISLFGKGGIGKTALAYEAVRRFAADAGFRRVAWASIGSLSYLPSGTRQGDEAVAPLWAEIVKRLADQLDIGVGYTRTTWVHDFVQGMGVLAPDEKCLIIIDNIEYPEDGHKVIDFFESHGITDRHKLLLGTRVSARSGSGYRDLTEVEVVGLQTTDAIAFIRHLGQGSSAIMQADTTDFAPILVVTEGNPYLIKLVIARFFVSHLPLTKILDELKGLNQRTALSQEVNNYLYATSLAQLASAFGEPDSAKFMSAFCPVGAGNAIAYAILWRYSGLTDEATFTAILRLACDLSLVQASGFERIYSIHSLLWSFTCK